MYRFIDPTQKSGFRIFPPVAVDTCPTVFTDDFTRSNGFVGMNYICPEHGGTGLFNVDTNRLAYASSGNSGLEGCAVLGAAGLVGKASQYIEMELISVNANNRLGLATHQAGEAPDGAAGNMQAYFFHLFTATINLFGLKPGGTGYNLALGLGSPAANDIFGLQTDIGVSDARVRLWQNGTLLADVTDSDAGRPGRYGLPGLLGTGNLGGGSTWDNLEVRETR